MNWFPRPFCLIAFLCLLTAFLSAASAQQTIHVTAGGSIQAGIDAANNGDTVLVAPGTYNENIDFKGKAITVTSGAKSFADASAAIISGVGNDPVVVFKTNETTASVLNGFTVEHGTTSAVYVVGTSPSLTNNVITNNVNCAVIITSPTANPLIQGNHISNTTINGADKSCNVPASSPYYGSGGTPGVGIGILNAGNVQIVGNTIEQNSGGIFVQYASNLLFSNNVIRNNQSYGLNSSDVNELFLVQNLIYENVGDFVGVSIGNFAGSPTTSRLVLTNNTIFGNVLTKTTTQSDMTGEQLYLSGDFGQTTISNNLFVSSNTLSAVYCAPIFYGTYTMNRNDVFNAGTLQSNPCASSASAASNLAVDPQFLDPVGGDFHTQRSSPVVAAGDINALSIPPADLDNKARAVCGSIDMGVYEIRPQPPIALTGSANPSPGGSFVFFTARLTGNCNVPTGTVTFLDGNTVMGTATLNNSAVATFSTSALFVGSHNITATYAGDFNFDSSTSNTVIEVITGYPTTTVLNAVSPNPAHALAPITFSATMTSAFGTPTGSVNFIANGQVLATAVLNGSGIATATTSTVGAGTYAVTAVYTASVDFAGSASNTITETVLGSDTATSLTASPNPSAPGQPILFTAKVSAAEGAGTPSGTVAFKDGAVTLGSATVAANGIATFITSALLTGTHPITATFGGSTNYNPSTSSPVNAIVTAIPTSIGLNASPNPASLGQNVTLVATVVSSLPNQTPTGNVTFSDQSGVLGTSPLTAGVAAFSTTSLSAGTHTITATLNPTGSYAPSSSNSVAEVITDFNFAVTASSTSLAIPSGDYQIITITVTPSGGFPRAVNLQCSSLPEHTQCSFTPSTTKPLSDGAQIVKLLVDTSDVLGYGHQVSRLTGAGPGPSNTSVLFVGLLLPFFFGGLRSSRLGRIRNVRRFLLLLASAGAAMSLVACSGKLPGATPPGAYTFTLTAADAQSGSSLVHTLNVNLQVTASQ